MNSIKFASAIRALLPGLVVILLGACAGSRGGPIPYDVQAFGVPDAPQALSQENYRIAAGDTLTVTVYGVEDLSRDYLVDMAGNLPMPLIGNVPAIGLTPEELRGAIASRLDARYMNNADVTVAIKESANRNITVDGSVRQPGVFPVTGTMTLMQAVALARGADENANPRRVAIFRRVQGQRMAAAFDLVSIRRGTSQDPEVYAGDIVVVDGSRTRGIWKDIIASLPVLSLWRPY